MVLPKFSQKTWHERHEDSLSFSERVACKITDFSGSMKFIYAHIIWWGFWFILNSSLFHVKFDTYPYQLLTMILSLEAILLGAFILMGQNLQTRRDKIQAEHDREMVAAILAETDEIKKLNITQTKILHRLEGGNHGTSK